MVNEREDNYSGHEEEEYHFSDDQASYEVEPETLKTTPPSTFKDNAIANFTRFRRPIVGVIVFFVLLFIVYKMLTPSSSTVSTDITQTTIPKTASTIPQPAPVNSQAAYPTNAAANTNAPAPVMTQVVSQPPAPIPPAPVDQNANLATSPTIATPQNLPAPLPTVLPTSGTPPSQTLTNQPVATIPVTQAGVAAPATMPQTLSVAAPQGTVEERLAALEQQNARLMTFLQADYAQKMAAFEASNSSTQVKMQELSNRVANIESALNQLTQLLPGVTKTATTVTSVPVPALPPVRSVEPKIGYTVQAIIPGRAWLKSDSGETVTVAEGDILKDYGRITKIDPYDGVVEINVDGKTVTLSYGVSGD